MATFDPRQISRVLNAHSVDYVVVGGFAAVLHGSALPTADVDVVPSRSDENLRRLGDALRELDAKLRIRVASLDAIIESKRAAGCEKDERALPHLESLRDELDGT